MVPKRSPGTDGEQSSLLRAIECAVYREQPNLRVDAIDDGIRVEGEYLLLASDEQNRASGPLARHMISIKTSWSYPDAEPVVTILDASLPRGDRYHISPNGVCCIVSGKEIPWVSGVAGLG